MDFLNRLAKGLAAARAVVGSDDYGPKQTISCEDGQTRLHLESRRKRPEGAVFLRVSTAVGDGWAQIDMSPNDARALGERLIAFADARASEAAKPIRDIPSAITDQTQT